MFEGETLRSFKPLPDKSGLTFKDLYRYLTSHKEWKVLKEGPTPIEEFFVRVMEKKRDMKIVSQIYQFLHPLVLGNALDIRRTKS